MRTIDFSPLYRTAIGFDHLASLLDATIQSDQKRPTYPPYNIELTGEDQYRITMAIAGFAQSDLSIEVEGNTLTVVGQKPEEDEGKQYLYRGIAARNFERQFQLADHIKVTGASFKNGMLHVELEREIPEALKPRKITIQSDDGEVLDNTPVEKPQLVDSKIA
ncbi:Hsp20 family protein [Kaarinaea lacus]